MLNTPALAKYSSPISQASNYFNYSNRVKVICIMNSVDWAVDLQHQNVHTTCLITF